ncbi:hypothetical protein ACFLV4_06035 [Chloroflexota bacterium]
MVPSLHNFKLANLTSVISLVISLVGMAMQVVSGYGIILFIIAGILAIVGMLLFVIVTIKRKNIAKHLSQSIKDGTDLFLREVKDDDSYQIWVEDYQKWLSSTKDWISGNISKAAAIWLTNIVTGLTITYKGAYGGFVGEHNSYLNELQAFRGKLGELLTRY